MSWTSKYWDALQQLYWTPKYLGLESISQRHWQETAGRISVPKEMTNPKGPLYRRVTTAKEFSRIVRCHEETFNHIFELTFGILDAEITNEIFCRLIGEFSQDHLTSYGRELGAELGYPKLYDISQPDGYFVGENKTIAVELKFNAQTSPDQLAKYLLAMVVERSRHPIRKPIHLVYISPKPAVLMKTAFPFEATRLSSADMNAVVSAAKPSVVNALAPYETVAASVLDDLTVTAASWKDFDRVLSEQIASLSNQDPASRTVRRLLGGLQKEIHGHPGAGL